MADLYHILAQLCNQHQITPYRMCKDTGIPVSYTHLSPVFQCMRTHWTMW